MEGYRAVLSNRLEKLNRNLAQKSLRLILGDKVTAEILKGVHADGEFGAREIHRRFRIFVEDAVSDRLLSQGQTFSGAWRLDLNQDLEAMWSLEDNPATYLSPAAS
jgi:ATP-dependent Clp protease ATP-binding subunit ClpA